MLDKPSLSEMIQHHKGGVVYYTFPHLGWGVKHAIFTRLGGVSHFPFAGLNVGHLVGDEDKAVEANHRIIYETIDLSAEEVVTARQVHGHSVAVVGPKDKGRIVPATDGLVTESARVGLMLRFADCLPILLYDPQKRVIGLGHAGWRGTVGLLAQRLAQTMREEFGCHLGQVRAALGPAIGPCCYSVGEEVREAVQVVLPHSSGALVERADGVYL
ncbi:MAG: polyphenol oxidase family protein, partial [Anaerolineae bacterium]